MKSKERLIEDLWVFQRAKLKDVDHYTYNYYPKVFFKPHSKEELCIGLFESEVAKFAHRDLYTEKVSNQFASEDPKRTLYKIPKEVIQSLTPHDTYVSRYNSNPMYLIPISRMQVVKVESENDKNIIFPDDIDYDKLIDAVNSVHEAIKELSEIVIFISKILKERK